MYAVISHRTAANVTVGDQTFEHQRWTLVETLTDDVKAQTEVPLGHKQPELRVLEVDGPEDPRLGSTPVVGHDPESPEAIIPVSPAAPLPDMDGLPDAAVKRLARSLDINGNQPRADLVAAIKAKHAEAENRMAQAESQRQAEAQAENQAQQ